MSVKFMESFDGGDWAKNLGAHSLTGLVSTSYGKNGNGARVGDISNGYFYIPGSTGNYLWITVGMHFRIVTVGSADNRMIDFAAGDYCRLMYDSTNKRLKFDIQISSVGHNYYYTPSGGVDVNVWHYVEVEMYVSTGSSGVLNLWLNGSQEVEASGIDFFQPTSKILVGGTGSDDIDAMDVDDVYYLDRSDGIEPTRPVGPLNMFELLPDGNGNTSQLVGQDTNSVDNYLNVDEATPDDGTTYNGSGTDGDKDTYSFGDVSGTPDDIPMMMLKMNAVKTDTGAKYMKPVVRAKTLADYTTTPTLSASTTDTTFVAGNAWRVAASFWKSTAVATTEWWKADFGSAKTFGQVDVDITAGGSTYPTVMDLEYSDDDSEWFSAGAQLTGVTAGSHTFEVDESGTHRYWRIVFSSFSGSAGMEADNIYFYEVSATLADVDGASQALAESYTMLKQGYGRNPGTNQFLEYADINAMEFGVKVSDT